MISQETRIDVNEKRRFVEKLSVTFKFIRLAWKPLLKYMIYLLLPICIIQAICLGSLEDTNKALKAVNYASGLQLVSEFFSSTAPKYIFLIFISLIGVKLLTALIYTLMKCYSENKDIEITTAQIHPLLKRNIKKMVKLIFFTLGICVIIFVIMGLLAKLSTYSLFISVPILLISIIPFCLFIPVYLFEDISVYKAFAKAFEIGFPTWGGTLSLLLTTSIIAIVISILIGLPYLSTTLLKHFFKHGTELNTHSFNHHFWYYVFCIFYLFGSCLGRCVIYIAMGYQYGHSDIVSNHKTN